MSAIQPTTTTTTTPVVRLTPTGSWLTQMMRLTRWFLYLSWRRLLGKILLAILLGLFVLVIGAVVLARATTGPVQGRDITTVLTFPTTLAIGGTYVGFVGLIVLCILIGAVVGGEYGFSTQRMMLARGSGRAQVIIAQIVAVALLALGTALALLLLSALVGVTIGPAFGGTIQSVTGQGWGELALYWLTISFQLFAYMLVAFFMATLGRSTAAGIGFSLGYLVFEQVSGTIFAIVGRLIQNNVGAFISHIPDWFLGTTTGTLTTQVANSPIALNPGSGQSPISTQQALITTIAYCVVLIVLSFVLVRRRDVTD